MAAERKKALTANRAWQKAYQKRLWNSTIPASLTYLRPSTAPIIAILVTSSGDVSLSQAIHQF
jgi:hypothetical protein